MNGPVMFGNCAMYWSGAAIAFAGDVRLRAMTDNTRSLDWALARVAECCLPTTRRWRARELLTRIDELTGHRVFMPLYERYHGSEAFPDLGASYRELGIKSSSGGGAFDDGAEYAKRRARIMGEESLP